MHNLLKGTTFRERVVEYIRANLRSYLPGLDSAEAVQKIPIEREAACQGPPSPEHPEYDRLLKRNCDWHELNNCTLVNHGDV
jgi:hypothetical protein